MKIIVAPYSRSRKDGKRNPKNYPWWQLLLEELASDRHELTVITYGEEEHINVAAKTYTPGRLYSVESLLESHDMFMSVDNYMQHMAHFLGVRGVVMYGPSDPRIFGYKENLNLYEDEKFFRPHQFQTWDECDFSEDAFMRPEKALPLIREFINAQ